MSKITLEKRSAIITGASQGLGLEIAKEFINKGANILICARDKQRLKDAYNSLNKNLSNKNKILMVKCDVSNNEEVKNMIELARSEFTKIDILVNNAGVYGPKGPFEENNLQEWKNSFDINFLSLNFFQNTFHFIFK